MEGDPMKRHLWMVTYDISADTTRRQVERALAALGERAQYSVFECHFTLPEARLYLGRLAAMLDTETDSLRAYPFCGGCEPAIAWMGRGERSTNKRVWLI
jgi:CRISPR-associated endonuclease Cas2